MHMHGCIVNVIIVALFLWRKLALLPSVASSSDVEPFKVAIDKKQLHGCHRFTTIGLRHEPYPGSMVAHLSFVLSNMLLFFQQLMTTHLPKMRRIVLNLSLCISLSYQSWVISKKWASFFLLSCLLLWISQNLWNESNLCLYSDSQTLTFSSTDLRI